MTLKPDDSGATIASAAVLVVACIAELGVADGAKLDELALFAYARINQNNLRCVNLRR